MARARTSIIQSWRPRRGILNKIHMKSQDLDKRIKCYYCNSKEHKNCKWCVEHAPKCWMCRFYDKDELTKEEREQINAGDIRINRIQCLKCKDIITSNNRHDWKQCKCKAVFIDGGSCYSRQGGSLEHIKDMCVKYKDS